MINTLVIALSLALPVVAAAEEVAKRPQWWEIATGVLAIPAALLGLVYSVVLIRKTRVEVKKTQLEIEEKEAALRKVVETSAHVASTLIPPLIESKHVQLFVLRFVLLWVTLQLWRLVGDVFNLFLGGVYLGFQQLTAWGADNSWLVFPFFLLTNLPKLGELVLLVGLGLPLFRDVSGVLGIDLNSVVFFWRGNAHRGP